ncbi:hypothetical protein CC79DRAFT_1341661 [Sarocladium strictum]
MHSSSFQSLLVFGLALGARSVLAADKDLVDSIWENPELGYKEVKAHKVLTDYLEDLGFNVTRSAFNLTTAFRAEYSNGKGRVVSFNSEYDALPRIGHACGHNLIATVGVASAIGVKEALETGDVKGTVVLLGTPAEEGLGGKVKMLDAGAYDDVDCSLMAHPAEIGYVSWARTLASWRANVNWTGVSAHAAVAPWEGSNALDGFVSAYTMAGLYRQQIQPTDRIHHVVTSGWSVANIIPDIIQSQWGVRGPQRSRREVVINRVRNIFNASSLATNTSVTIDEFQDYWDKLPNFPLADTYYKNQMKYMDPANFPETANWTVTSAEESREKEETLGSTDQGNVSWKVPAIQVIFPIGGKSAPHNAVFRESAGTDFAHEQAIRTAKILALTGLEVLENETYAKDMWKQWKIQVEEASEGLEN